MAIIPKNSKSFIVDYKTLQVIIDADNKRFYISPGLIFICGRAFFYKGGGGELLPSPCRIGIQLQGEFSEETRANWIKTGNAIPYQAFFQVGCGKEEYDSKTTAEYFSKRSQEEAYQIKQLITERENLSNEKGERIEQLQKEYVDAIKQEKDIHSSIISKLQKELEEAETEDEEFNIKWRIEKAENNHLSNIDSIELDFYSRETGLLNALFSIDQLIERKSLEIEEIEEKTNCEYSNFATLMNKEDTEVSSLISSKTLKIPPTINIIPTCLPIQNELLNFKLLATVLEDQFFQHKYGPIYFNPYAISHEDTIVCISDACFSQKDSLISDFILL